MNVDRLVFLVGILLVLAVGTFVHLRSHPAETALAPIVCAPAPRAHAVCT